MEDLGAPATEDGTPHDRVEISSVVIRETPPEPVPFLMESAVEFARYRASASTFFFIVTADAPTLDGRYTAFGRVIDGMAAVEPIEQSPVNGEAPVARVELKPAGGQVNRRSTSLIWASAAARVGT